jgi:hypothetical protein
MLPPSSDPTVPNATASAMPSAASKEDGSKETTLDSDLISTIESDLTLLIQIMSSSLHYISNKSAHSQLNADIPLYNPVGAGQVMASKFLVEEKVMAESIEELTDDLVGKVKDISRLVDHLPVERDEGDVKLELEGLQKQVASVNEDYRSALSEAGECQTEWRLKRPLADSLPPLLKPLSKWRWTTFFTICATTTKPPERSSQPRQGLRQQSRGSKSKTPALSLQSTPHHTSSCIQHQSYCYQYHIFSGLIFWPSAARSFFGTSIDPVCASSP